MANLSGMADSLSLRGSELVEVERPKVLAGRRGAAVPSADDEAADAPLASRALVGGEPGDVEEVLTERRDLRDDGGVRGAGQEPALLERARDVDERVAVRDEQAAADLRQRAAGHEECVGFDPARPARALLG